ncbi:MAG: endonuclease III [Bacteroidota bacterium]|nr:endonuclease III [Bacteroidota bacterium]
MSHKVYWEDAITPLIEKYKGRQHPLEYKSIYQLLVMVVLSAQDSDKHINSLALELFTHFPNMEALSNATADTLFPLVGKVRNFANKVKWLIAIATQLKADENIPLTMEELVALPGIGRKSANVIMREAGAAAEGVMVDLHVVRVSQRLGIATSADPKKIEQQIMDQIPKSQWGESGMAISFLGRETCRPSHPQHEECVMSSVCKYYKEVHES